MRRKRGDESNASGVVHVRNYCWNSACPATINTFLPTVGRPFQGQQGEQNPEEGTPRDQVLEPFGEGQFREEPVEAASQVERSSSWVALYALPPVDSTEPAQSIVLGWPAAAFDLDADVHCAAPGEGLAGEFRAGRPLSPFGQATCVNA